MTPRKFIVLNNRDLAIVNGTSGLTRLPFTAEDVSTNQTVTFDTTNPCIAIVDNDGTQWDLNSKRVWYSDTQVTIDLTDILAAKGLITTPASFTTLSGTYVRDARWDSPSGYSWRLTDKVAGATNVPPFLYTQVESPSVGTPAYLSNTTTGTSTPIQTVSSAVATDITGSWDAIFTVSDPISGSTITGIAYTPVP